MEMNLKDIERQTAAIDGWLSKKEGRLLYKLAQSCSGKGTIVEIGS